MTKLYQLVEDGVTVTRKQVLPKFYKGINNFNNQTDAALAEHGFYLVIEEPILENQKQGDYVITSIGLQQLQTGVTTQRNELPPITEQIPVLDPETGMQVEIGGVPQVEDIIVPQFEDVEIPQYKDVEVFTINYPAIDKLQSEIDEAILSIQANKIAQLWQAAHDYEYIKISGSALSMLTVLLLNSNVKGVAVQLWIKSIWDEYYTRKNMVYADHTVEINTDFSFIGDIPHTVPELMVEYMALIGL